MRLDKPVQRESVVNIVLNKIKDALVNGEIKPGDKLPTEQEFSEKLGIGRTTVREAMKMLRALGVINVRQGDGTYVVKQLNTNSINSLIFSLLLKAGSDQQLVELRHTIEVGYTKLAIEKITDSDLREIKNVLDQQIAAVKKGEKDLGQYEMKFHQAILKACKNPFLIEIGETVFKLFEASIKNTTKKVPEQAIKHHKLIFQALLDRDKHEAEEAIYKSFEIWKDHVHDL